MGEVKKLRKGPGVGWGVGWTRALLLAVVQNKGSWFTKIIVIPIIHDPLTFLWLPRAWRHDYWNVIDAATIGCAWAAFACAAMPGRHLSADLAVVTAILMWIRFCWYLKNLRLGWAKFVLMIEQIAWDLRYYLVYFSVVLMMFASAFYLYLGPRKSDEFGFHDDGAPSAFGTFPYTIFNLILLGWRAVSFFRSFYAVDATHPRRIRGRVRSGQFRPSSGALPTGFLCPGRDGGPPQRVDRNRVR